VQHETFGPLLYLLTYRDFDEAIAIQNGVPQGLTSSIFTNDVREAGRNFVSAVVGSDCGDREREHRQRAVPKLAVRSAAKEKIPAADAKAAAIPEKLYAPPDETRLIFRRNCPLAQGIPFGTDDLGVVRLRKRNCKLRLCSRLNAFFRRVVIPSGARNLP